MKVWTGYGSEHSMDLVMIGRFKEARDAKKVKELFKLLIEQVRAEPEPDPDASPKGRRFSDAMIKLLENIDLYSIGPDELLQFNYDVRVHIEGSEVVVNTDEVDVSAFLKVLLDKGARVEVYSRHDYPDKKEGSDS